MPAWRNFPLPDGSYSDDTRPWSQQDVVNYLPTFAEAQNTRSPVLLRTAPGMRYFAYVGDGPHRGAHNCEGRRFVVSGRKLYQVDTAGKQTELGTIPGTGRVTMAHNQIANGNEVIIGTVDNSYVWNTVTETLTATGVALQSVDFINQRFVGVDQQRRFWRHSALVDGLTWSDLDVFSSESAPDRIVGLKVLDGQVYVFNERTIEVFTDAPTETQVFQRSVVIQRGCISGDTICRVGGKLFFVGDDYMPYRLDGYTPVPIGTKAIVGELSKHEPRRLFGMVWEDRGYLVYYVTATDGMTLGHDLTTGKWHRRESYGRGRWAINTLCKFDQDWYAGSAYNGGFYKLEWDYVYEGCEIMPRKLRTGVLHNAQNRVRISAFSLLADTGKPEITPTKVSKPELETGNLLITGTAKSGSDAVWCKVTAEDTPIPTALSIGIGADIDATCYPAWYNDTWVVVGDTQARVSTDNLVSFQSISQEDAGSSTVSVAGGAAGWLIVKSTLNPIRFASSAITQIEALDSSAYADATNYDGSDASAYLQSAYRGFVTGGYYWATWNKILFRCSSPQGPWASIYDPTSPNWTGNPNGDSIQNWLDLLKVGDRLYAIVAFDFTANRRQIRWSPDNGATWPSANVLLDIASDQPNRPIELCAIGDDVIALASDGGVWSSTNNWSELISTGLTAPPSPSGRHMISANGRVFIIGYDDLIGTDDGDKLVSGKIVNGVLEFGTPVTLPIKGAFGIAAQEVDQYKVPSYEDCQFKAGGFFQLRYSDDGGENYSNYRDFERPKAGNFLQPLIARRVGMARHRVWEIMDASGTAQDVLAASIIVESE